MSGEYKEKLPSGKGEIIVSVASWYIQYYFPGIDLRHNGTFVKIPEQLVGEFIVAYKKNRQKYCQLKETHGGSNAELKVIGEKNMTIYIRGPFDGVCIQSYHMPLNTEAKIQAVTNDYYWAIGKAEKIIQMLRQLE